MNRDWSRRYVGCEVCGAKAYTPRQLRTLVTLHQIGSEAVNGPHSMRLVNGVE
ncbi:MAG: hypothetical protein ACE5KU_04785 [Nitrososphaerales archaeon]